MTVYNQTTMKTTMKLRRAPRQKEGETDKSFKARLAAYNKAKAIKEYERDDDDEALTPEQAELAARIEAEAALDLDDPDDETVVFLKKHHENERTARRAAIVAAPTGKPEPHEVPGDLDPVLSRLDGLLDRVAGLESLVDKLARLIAITVPERSLKPAAKAAVLTIAPELAEAYRDERVRELHETFEHVVGIGYHKKRSANFPRALDDSIDFVGRDPDKEKVCRIIPHSALIARCAAKKAFRVVEGEESAVQNVKHALTKSGLIVTTLHAAGLKRGSQVKIVMDHAEAVARGLVKGLAAAPEPEVKPRASFDKSAWQDEPEPAANDEDLDTVPLVVLEPEPTTTDAVDDEGIDTETEWEEEEDDGYNEDPIALFRESGEQQKSSKAIDLFA
jgi:hypothetical protein